MSTDAVANVKLKSSWSPGKTKNHSRCRMHSPMDTNKWEHHLVEYLTVRQFHSYRWVCWCKWFPQETPPQVHCSQNQSCFIQQWKHQAWKATLLLKWIISQPECNLKRVFSPIIWVDNIITDGNCPWWSHFKQSTIWSVYVGFHFL